MKSFFQKSASFCFLFLVLVYAPLLKADGEIKRIHFSEVDSTQIYAKAHAAELVNVPGQWAVVTADVQTNGLGHQGRKWVSSSPRNLYATFVTMYPRSKDHELFHIIQISALSVTKTLQELGLNPGIKWVNDVLVNNKKISGSLCEILPSKSKDYYYLFFGIGINVNMTQGETILISPPATSIFAETNQEISQELVLKLLTSHLKSSVNQLLDKGFSELFQEISGLLVYKGDLIEVELEPGSTVRGKMIGINEEGALLLERNDQVIQIPKGRILRD